MSADNWTVCPRCALRRGRVIAEKDRAVTDSYGSVSVVEFDRLRAELAEMQASSLKATFREDYELGLDGDLLEVIYKGRCTACELTKEFRHSEQLNLDEPS